VVKTLDDLDSEESLEVTGIQCNERVIALVNIRKMLFKITEKDDTLVTYSVYSR
jgi:hypothetical protein